MDGSPGQFGVLSRHAVDYRATNGVTFLFNPAYFKPVRLGGAPQEIRLLLEKLRRGELTDLPEPARRLLMEHGLLVDPQHDPSPNDSVARPRADLTLRMPTRITAKDAVFATVDLIRQHLFPPDTEQRFTRLNLKFVWDGLAGAPLYDHLVGLVTEVLRRLSFDQDTARTYLDLPISQVAGQVDALRRFIVPNVRLSIYVVGQPPDSGLQVIDHLIDRWGFLPHFVFILRRDMVPDVPAVLQKMRKRWGPEFKYAFSIPLRMPSNAAAMYRLWLPTPEQIEDLVKFMFGPDAPEPIQSALYEHMLVRLNAVPTARACACCDGCGLHVSADGRVSRCLLEAVRSPGALRNADEAALRELAEPTNGQWPRRTECATCDLRWLCGGVCPLLGQVTAPADRECNDAAFPLRCRFRRAMVERFLERLTEPGSEGLAWTPTARFVSGDYKIELTASAMRAGGGT